MAPLGYVRISPRRKKKRGKISRKEQPRRHPPPARMISLHIIELPPHKKISGLSPTVIITPSPAFFTTTILFFPGLSICRQISARAIYWGYAGTGTLALFFSVSVPFFFGAGRLIRCRETRLHMVVRTFIPCGWEIRVRWGFLVR